MTFIYDEKTMNKIRTIEKHIDWILDIQEVCELLSCSERTVYRMKKQFITLWPPWLIHGLKGKPSNHQGDNTKYADIRRIVKGNSKYHDFWPTLLAEHLEQDFWIKINKETLRQIMIKLGIRVAKPKRKKIIRKKRERCAHYWAMIQFDGSYHDWFENGEYPCLLCAVDDATGSVYAQFSHWESFEKVFAFWKKYFTLFGKPEKIYVDCHATYKVHSPDDYWDEKKRTCFEKGMRKLGIIVIFSKTPQGKGRVEKGNRTHQDRLVKKMRLLDIKTIEDGNKYLEEVYLKDHNERFAVVAREEWDRHSKLSDEEKRDLERYFAKEIERTVKNDGTIQYNHKTYQLKKWLILKNKWITVKESIYGNVRLYDWTDCLRWTENP